MFRRRSRCPWAGGGGIVSYERGTLVNKKWAGDYNLVDGQTGGGLSGVGGAPAHRPHALLYIWCRGMHSYMDGVTPIYMHSYVYGVLMHSYIYGGGEQWCDGSVIVV